MIILAFGQRSERLFIDRFVLLNLLWLLFHCIIFTFLFLKLLVSSVWLLYRFYWLKWGLSDSIFNLLIVQRFLGLRSPFMGRRELLQLLQAVFPYYHHALIRFRKWNLSRLIPSSFILLKGLLKWLPFNKVAFRRFSWQNFDTLFLQVFRSVILFIIFIWIYKNNILAWIIQKHQAWVRQLLLLFLFDLRFDFY